MTKFLENRKSERKITKPIVVFYHGNCTDGFTGAWVAWKKFGNKAEYIGYTYDDFVPNLKGKEIYTIDMTFEDPVLTERLTRNNKHLTSIDHHVSNKERTLATYKPLYALNHSGCTLAWQYFFPQKKVPRFLLLVEDMDLWRQKITGGQDLYNYLDLVDFNFKIYDKIIKDFENSKKRKQILDAGKLLSRYENRMIARHISRYAKLVRFAGHKVYAINSTDDASETGDRLYNLLPPFSIIWREIKDGQVIVSLRGDGSVDTSKIAGKYGGGGHRNSSGFVLPSLKQLPWKDAKQ